MTLADQPSLPVLPGGTIGILGGGQLGRMLALAAAKLGLKTHIYSDEADAPALDVATLRTVASFDDKAALTAFARSSDAVTFEFENVPSAAVAFLAQGKPTHPDARALAVTQDRLAEKTFLSGLGIGTAEFARADCIEEASAALSHIGVPAILKTRQLGYDGKGQAKIAVAGEIASAVQSLRKSPAILESLVDFAFECSVIAARAIDGSFAAYDPPENLHADHILRRSKVPARLTPEQSARAQAITRQIADALDYVGVLAVEFFLTKSSTLLVNEIAPRVHNSGHWTLEACVVSQFEQHIRAVAGWPLGDPLRHSDAVMNNLIGAEADDWQSLARGTGALHLYGKHDARPGRKMGHITRLSPLGGAPNVRVLPD
jgi:5-(carboxyamino)imidazole ribonucleotide synthase